MIAPADGTASSFLDAPDDHGVRDLCKKVSWVAGLQTREHPRQQRFVSRYGLLSASKPLIYRRYSGLPPVQFSSLSSKKKSPNTVSSSASRNLEDGTATRGSVGHGGEHHRSNNTASPGAKTTRGLIPPSYHLLGEHHRWKHHQHLSICGGSASVTAVARN